MAKNDPPTTISQSDLLQLLIPLLRRKGKFYHKSGTVLARKATEKEQIHTLTSQGHETSNTAHPGDYIIKNPTAAGELYVVPATKFNQRYRYLNKGHDGFDQYLALGQIIALPCEPDIQQAMKLHCPFQLEAPWGDTVTVFDGDWLVCPPDFSEVYKISPAEFAQTYELQA